MKMKALWRRHFVGSIYERCRSSTRRNVISWVQSYNKNGHNSERGQLSPVQMERRRRNIVICTDIFTNPCRFSSRATAQRSPPVQRAERSTISLVSSIAKLAPSRKNHSNLANFPKAIKGLIALENLKIQRILRYKVYTDCHECYDFRHIRWIWHTVADKVKIKIGALL